jgi:hypothetical protein
VLDELEAAEAEGERVHKLLAARKQQSEGRDIERYDAQRVSSKAHRAVSAQPRQVLAASSRTVSRPTPTTFTSPSTSSFKRATGPMKTSDVSSLEEILERIDRLDARAGQAAE